MLFAYSDGGNTEDIRYYFINNRRVSREKFDYMEILLNQKGARKESIMFRKMKNGRTMTTFSMNGGNYD
jgi:hypothetical protein